MSESFVPELHDIGKLFDRGELFGSGCGHTFRGKNGLYDFSPLGISVPDNLTWKGITLHHSWWKIPPGELSSDERDTLWLLTLADNIASQAGRSPEKYVKVGVKGQAVATALQKPWNYSNAGSPESDSIDDFKAIIDFIASGGSWNDFKELSGGKYYRMLASIPEDKTIPRSTLPLLSHMELVGKLYRVFEKVVRFRDSDNNERVAEYEGIIASTPGEAKDRWEFNLAQVTVAFPQKPARLKDLGVLSLTVEAVEGLLKGQWRHNVLLNAGSTLWLLIPNKTSLHSVVEAVTDTGLHVEAKETRGPLNLLIPGFVRYRDETMSLAAGLQKEKKLAEEEEADINQKLKQIGAKLAEPGSDRRSLAPQRGKLFSKSNEIQRRIARLEKELKKLESSIIADLNRFDSIAQQKSSIVYPKSLTAETAREFAPPICEICQLRPAVVNKAEDEDDLCSVCSSIRKRTSPFRNLAEWDGQDGTRVAWMKIGVAQDRLPRALLEMFASWARKHGLEKKIGSSASAENWVDVFNPFATEAAFYYDYNSFLKDLYDRISTQDTLVGVKKDRLEFLGPEGLPELYCFKLESGLQLEDMLRIYLGTLARHFPKVNADCPVRCAVSLGGIKSPFFAHWQYLSKPREAFNIQVLFGSQVAGDLNKIGILLKLREKVRLNTSKSMLHRIAAFESQLIDVEYAVELELLDEENRNNPLAAFFKQHRAAGITGSDVLSYYRIAFW